MGQNGYNLWSEKRKFKNSTLNAYELTFVKKESEKVTLFITSIFITVILTAGM